jgi:hypothetical protein
MAYNPTTDFVALWRAVSGGVRKADVPGLDFVVAALGRSGLINIYVSETAPLSNQATTAWFQPTEPTYTAEGNLFLWNANTNSYQTATAWLLLEMLAATEAAASSSVVLKLLLDTLDSTEGDLLVRGASEWEVLPAGPVNYVLSSTGPSSVPVYAPGGGVTDISALLDTLGNAEGDILVRGASLWEVLAAGTNGYVLTSGGPGVVPSYAAVGAAAGVTSIGGASGVITLQSGMAVAANKLSFMTAGTLMTFQQTAAPIGWTKQVTHNDKALRVVSGAAASGGVSPFSTVFAKTGTDNHTLVAGEMPSHSHAVVDPGHTHPISVLGSQVGLASGTDQNVAFTSATGVALTGIAIGSAGGDGAHAHTMDIRVQYVDLIIASKDA